MIIIFQFLILSFKNSTAFFEERVEILVLRKEFALGQFIKKKSKLVLIFENHINVLVLSSYNCNFYQKQILNLFE